MPTYRTRAFGYNLYYGSYCSGYYCKRKGLKISDDMKVSEQCGIAASKGNIFLG